MTLLAFVSARSPGLTTTVHALALAWPAPRRAMVAELNPEGGSLVARHDLAPEPGLTTLAAAGRRGLTPETVVQHCRPIPGGPLALLGPISSDQATSALSVLGPHLAAALDQVPDTDVLADCGRIGATSAALGVIGAARHVVMVVMPTLEGVACAQSRLEGLELRPGQVGLITVGARPYPPDQVGAALQLPVLGSIALDPGGTRELHAGRPSRRSPLMRSAARLATDLAGHLAPPAPAGDTATDAHRSSPDQRAQRADTDSRAPVPARSPAHASLGGAAWRGP